MPNYCLRGVEVSFPYEAYDCQLDYMSAVIQALQDGKNALLESPTGTGKTLCLLCATLAWRESLRQTRLAAPDAVRKAPHSSELVQGLREAYAEIKAEKAAKGDSLPTIIYSSRTHSQLKQVMSELNTTGYRPRVAVLGSRQQSCLHPKVQNLPTAACNQACRSLTSKRACKWHNNVEQFVKANPDVNENIMDIEELGKMAASRIVCPYYLSREMAGSAELVFLPYNYLVDAKTRTGLGITFENSILIFDEAHNVESVCSDAASFDLTAVVLAGAIEEAGMAAEIAMGQAEGTNRNVADEYGSMRDGSNMLATATSLRQLQLVLKRLENEIAAVKLTNDKGFTAPGSFLFDLLKKINLTRGTWGELSSALEAATNILTVDAVEAGRRHGSRASGYRLHELQEVFGLAFSTLEPRRPGAWPPHYGYRVHVHLQNQNQRSQQTPTLSYWCFNPGLAMEALADAKVRSIILTSGTLSPLGSFAHELGLPFEVRLENPHVIEPSQVWIGVVNKGPKGQTLNSSYEHRKNPEYKEDLGNAIVNYARIVPDGLLVFFPSYTLLSECLESWKSSSRYGSSTVWERISQYKASVIEPREAGLFPTAVADFRAKLDNPTHRGAVFFAVCRGKASEGLDFSDNAGRAVIITGIPYATKTDPKVQIKRDVLNDTQKSSKALKRPITGAPEHPDDREFVLNGNAWYVQQALRAVNQAMGRVIRHKKDFGAIILCDERFQQKNVQEQLSKWLRPMIQVFNNYGAASASLTKFFKDNSQLAGHDLSRNMSKSSSHVPSMVNFDKGKQSGFNQGSAFYVPARDSLKPKPPSTSLVAVVPTSTDMAGLAEMIGGSATSVGTQKRGGDVEKGGLLKILERKEQGLDEFPNRTKISSLCLPTDAGRISRRPWELSNTVSSVSHSRRAGPPHVFSNPSRHQLGTGSGTAPRMSKMDVVGPAHLVGAAHQRQAGQPSIGLNSKETNKISRETNTEHGGTMSRPFKDSVALNDKLKKAQIPASQQANEDTGRSATEKKKEERNEKNLLERLRTELPQESSRLILNALRQYGVDRDPTPLLAIAAQTLYPVRRENLMLAFKTCVPKKLWGSFDLEIEKNRSQALGLNKKPRVSNITNGTLTSIAPSTMNNNNTEPVSPLVNAAVNTSLSGGKAKSMDPPCIGKCALCTRSPMESPYTSRCCGRQACYTCWLKPLALHACPCGKGLKKSMLTKLYFK